MAGELREKVSLRQLMSMIVVGRIPAIALAFPVIGAGTAGRDAWLSLVMSVGWGLVMAGIFLWLMRRFPGMDLIQVLEAALGKIPGRLVGLLYFWFMLHLAANVTRSVADAFSGAVMPETPPVAFVVPMVLLGALSARAGIEVIGRMVENALPILISFALVVWGLTIPAWDLGNLLPFLEHGIKPVLVTSSISAGLAGEFIAVGMVMPHLVSKKGLTTFVLTGIIAGEAVAIVNAVVSYAAFGALATTITIPAFALARLVRLTELVERIEVIPMGAWTLSGYLKIGLLTYAAAAALARILGLARYRPLAFPIAAIIVYLAVELYPSAFEFRAFFKAETFGVYAPFLELLAIVPALAASLILGRRGGGGIGEERARSGVHDA